MAADEKPQWVQPRITAAPKIRQLYWCEYWRDARLPEMWKTRPVVVISYKNSLHGICTVVPLSTEPQDENPWAVRMSIKVDERSDSWAIANQIASVSTSRFIQFNRGFPLLPKADFNQILDRIVEWLPIPFDLET